MTSTGNSWPVRVTAWSCTGRPRMVVQAELGDLPTAKAALGTVMALLDGLEQEDDGAAEPDAPRPASRNRKKPA